MERDCERERVLLGYALRDPFAGSPRRRSSDVDFQDVFGGPPRRASFHGARRSHADSIDSHSRASWRREGSTDSRISHLGSSEKPVFGDGSWFSTDRRRQLGDDFFNDIFLSSDSARSSPRRGDLDPSLSSPNPNILSPKRSTSVSVSVKISDSFDYPSLGSPAYHSVFGIGDGGRDTFSSPSSPNAYSTAFAIRSSIGHGDIRNDGFVSHQQSPLACETSHSFECFPLAAEDAFVAINNQIGKCTNSLDTYISKNQFHFSIYKWAGKGVTLVMPSNLGARNECKGGLTRLPEVIVQEVQLPKHCDYLYPVTKASKNIAVTKKNNSENDMIRKAMEDDYTLTFANDVLFAKSDKKLQNDSNKHPEKGGEQIEDVLVQRTDKNSNANATYKKSSPNIMFYSHGEPHSEINSLTQLFVDDMDKSSSHNIPLKVKASEVPSEDQIKQIRKEKVSIYAEVNNNSMHDSSHSLVDKTSGRSKVKGKVKEFIKKFNQDATPKQRGAFEMYDHRSTSNGGRRDNSDEQAHASCAEVDELTSPRGSNNVPLFGVPNGVKNQVMENAEENKFHIFHGDHKINNLHSGEMMENICLQSETSHSGPHDGACKEENFPVDIEGYLVQQLSDRTEGIQNISQQEQIEGLDARVWEWSRGKEGNIRSLLSTLQYILWPDSGWKQVPLVDIIEGPSVKKAYQKALLCLHPDKLQQKGASWNQKYIAEKVFDILQEAWEHFNSIGQF